MFNFKHIGSPIYFEVEHVPVIVHGEEDNDVTRPSQSITLQNYLPAPGICVLDKLIKTCPVWLQLSMNRDRAGEILSKETAGIFLVRRDGNMNNMVLLVHFPAQNAASDVQEYNIKEEKSLLYLEGSVLVFEDIFKLVAFYCVSRDLLPFTLRLPQAILEANSFADLETIASLGIGFWDSSLNHRRTGGGISQPVKDSALRTAQMNNLRSSQQFASSTNHCSCEIELSIGNDKLWFVNPIFIEECSNSLPPDVPPYKSSSASADHCRASTPNPKRSPHRPPPPPPLPHSQVLKPPENDPSSATPPKCALPSIPPRRRPSERASEESCIGKPGKCELLKGEQTQEEQDVCTETTSECQEAKPKAAEKENLTELQRKPMAIVKLPPVPPPRKKRLSRLPASSSSCDSKQINFAEPDTHNAQSSSKESPQPEGDATCQHTQDESDASCKSVSSSELKGSHTSLDCPGSNAVAQTSASEPDSYSTSSMEDDLEQLSSPAIKKTRSVILSKAKHRLSFVSLTNVFTVFLSADRKLQKKIVELSQDKDSYFGNLVQDYKVYSLEMMAKQSSSTEMLQEIRMMMTQLKSYLIQSTELKSLIDPAVYKEEELEVIIESALYKCVLKPLKNAIDSYLREIHNKDGSLQLLKENQLVIQNTTTTDLGVTTSVPETVVLEKILQKFTTMHKFYSPEKKIGTLLKSCKLIYDSMAQGNPGKPYGADDFLPVLMYVLARSNLTEVLLNVEYMMELMDPALQLGEGSYYLTTTYGALEHIKNYDKITVTRQLSVEVQDSIHRWERRRTLNKARASHSSVQDFICISFLETGAQTRTMASRIDTTAQQLGQQCAEKFEVSDPQNYGLFVHVDDKCLQLADDAQPHHIKSYLLKSEPKKDFHFIYKLLCKEETQIPVIKEPDFL
uniref:Ras and Rab interactor 3 n=1 Tax=Chelonoidis abingdonii TaxID=106734 RepID=A0A8C0QQT0_CHEAB